MGLRVLHVGQGIEGDDFVGFREVGAFGVQEGLEGVDLLLVDHPSLLLCTRVNRVDQEVNLNVKL